MTASIKNPLIEFEDTGTYSVRYIASNGNRSDTITKSVTILPKINKDFLGNDTGWCEELGASLTLQAPSSMHCYEWNTGETSPQITASTAGVYIAKITTPNFCVLYDTLIVTLDTLPNIETNFLGEDRHWCENIDSSVILKAPDGFVSYQWNTGDTTQEIKTDNAGAYWVTAFTANGCTTADTLIITLDTLPNTATNFLGADISWCENLDTSVILKAPDNMFKYVWNTGDTTQQIETGKAGMYSVVASTKLGCSVSDTVIITLDTLPDIAPDFLGDDISWCENLDTSVILQAPDNMFKYVWNTNDTTQQIETDNKGVYWSKITAYVLS